MTTTASGDTGAQSGSSAAPGLAPAGTDELDVAIGATVAVTTDQKGNFSPFNFFITNGQISGEGSGTVTIPTGPDTSEEFEFENKAGEVQTFTELNGIYKDKLPVGVSAEVTVNGEEIDPDEGYDLTGDVVIKYKFSNTSSRKQTIEIKAPDGSIITKEAEVPVSFGGTFLAPFGEGWFIEEAKGMTQKDTATGTTLGATVIAFPISEGVGTLNPVFEIKARAENASLPPTSTAWVPVDLSTYVNGLALDIVPGVESKVLAPLNSAVQGTVAEVVSIGSVIGGWAGAFDQLNTQSLDPLLDSITALSFDPDDLSNTLLTLSGDLNDMGELMSASAQAQLRLVGLFDDLAETIGVSTADLVKELGLGLKELGPDFKQASKGLLKINKVLLKLRADKLQENIDTLQPDCAAIGDTSNLYGYGPLSATIPLPPPLPDIEYELWGGSDGYNAVANAIKDNTPGGLFPDPTPEWVTDLEEFQGILDDQSKGTLPPSLTFGVIPDLGDGDPGEPGLFQRPRCQSMIDITEDVVLPIAKAWDAKEMAKTAVALAAIGEVLSSKALQAKFTATEKALNRIGKLLSNDECSLAGVADVIESGQGAAAIFENCGVAQLFTFLAAVDALVADGVTDLSDVFTGLAGDAPKVAQAVQDISDASASVKSSLNELPGVLGEAANGIISAGGEIGAKGDSALTKAALGTAEIQAMLLAMTQRVIDGDGAPYGGATGPNTRTLAAYQFTTTAPTPASTRTTTNLLLAAVFLVLAIGVGTWVARRRRNK